jgi:hypothetical protein
VTKCDAGEAGDEDEPLKSAVSDALKRCAVHFGIGRYLYHLPAIWAPYDSQKRRFSEAPKLSSQAVAKALSLCSLTPGPERRPESPPPESSGDRAANRQPGQVAAEAHVAAAESRAGMPGAEPQKETLTAHCSGAGCGKSLTKGQVDMSTRAYGQPLCPACQKQHARQAT